MSDFVLFALFYLLNYFWLSWDPKESASWYCDQHCFKIGAEVVESVWDAVLAIEPKLDKLADDQGIPKTYRKRRHSREDCLWHPLSVWNGLTRSNLHRNLLNANEIFREHQRRTGTIHSAWQDCKFLLANINNIDFNTNRWKKWYKSQNGDEHTRYKPTKTKIKDLKLRAQWCLSHTYVDGVNVSKLDRNRCAITEPPQCINEKEFPGCKNVDIIDAYHNYYRAKTQSMKHGMRYLYTKPPALLKDCKIQTKRTGK
ncbi:MAG TPA: hypothetical protein PKD85_00650 [Saprospiraceae bacterium]|nr:hypothetical protein [Saprospiraceae bacterium]